MTHSAYNNENNNSLHNDDRYLPALLHVVPTNEKDENGHPIPDVKMIDGRGEGEQQEVSKVLRHLNKTSRRIEDSGFKGYLTSQERFHGGHRQKLWGLWQELNGDHDAQKRGGDRIRRYSDLLAKADLESIDWDTAGVEIYMIGLSRWDAVTKEFVYSGFCVFVEDTAKGAEIIRRLHVGVANRKAFLKARKVQQAQQLAPVEEEKTVIAEAFEKAEEATPRAKALPETVLQASGEEFTVLDAEKVHRSMLRATTSRPPFSSAGSF